MKSNDLTRPDKMLLKGIKTLGGLTHSLYSNKKTEAKNKAELTFIGKKKMEKVQSQLYKFNLETYTKTEKIKDFSFIQTPDEDWNYWLNFHGLHDVKVIQKIGDQVNMNRLTIRQILDTTQRPKMEEHNGHLFFSIKSILKNDQGELTIEQISFIMGAHYIVSFQEVKGDHFEGIRNKIVEGLGYIRKNKCDYLLSQLLDAILDNYFETIDKINQELTMIEHVTLKNPDSSTLIVLETHKRSAQAIKKSLIPFKEALHNILNAGREFIEKGNIKYYKDLVNSATAAIDEIDTTQKNLEGLTNIYFSSLSNKMNETMKILTTVATIFIPLTFVAGIYGMNFENMPELRYKYGYFVVWSVIGIIAIGMLIFFKRKKWI